MTGSDEYLAFAAQRRTIYNLTPETTIPDSKLEEIVRKTLLVTPNAFNTQSARIVVLLGEQHKKLWDIVKGAIMPHVAGDAERSASTEAKLSGFQSSGYATVLFFEDPATYEPLLGLKSYADKFPAWREQGSGMHQLVLWTALEAEGLGVHVQHYNPAIDDEVKATWKDVVDPNWKLTAQMVVGKPAGEAPAPKEKAPVEKRYKMLS